MKPDYFGDLAGVTRVTQPENGCVTPEAGENSLNHAESGQAPRMSRTSRTETINLEEVRDRVWRALQGRPDQIKFFEVVDPDADPVRVVVAIRGIGTADLLIVRDRWDPMRLLELLDASGDAEH